MFGHFAARCVADSHISSVCLSMETALLKAQHYYSQAKNMRALAAAEEDQASRDALLEIAKGYEKLASNFLQQGQGPRDG